MKWKRFLGTLCCHKAVFLRGVTSTLNSFYATKRQPLLFFNEKCGLGARHRRTRIYRESCAQPKPAGAQFSRTRTRCPKGIRPLPARGTPVAVTRGLHAAGTSTLVTTRNDTAHYYFVRLH